MSQHYRYHLSDGTIGEHESACIAHFYKDYSDEILYEVYSESGDEIGCYPGDISMVISYPKRVPETENYDEYKKLVYNYLAPYVSEDLELRFGLHISKPFLLFIMPMLRSIDEEGDWYIDKIVEYDGHILDRWARLYDNYSDYDFYNLYHQTSEELLSSLSQSKRQILIDNWDELLDYLLNLPYPLRECTRTDWGQNPNEPALKVHLQNFLEKKERK